MNMRTFFTALALVIASAIYTTAAELPGGKLVRDLRWSEVKLPSGATVNKEGHDGAYTPDQT